MGFIRAARAAGLAWMLAVWGTAAPAQVSDGVVRIGVLTDPGAGAAVPQTASIQARPAARVARMKLMTCPSAQAARGRRRRAAATAGCCP